MSPLDSLLQQLDPPPWHAWVDNLAYRQNKPKAPFNLETSVDAMAMATSMHKT